jgi:cell division protein FtsL
MTALKSSRRVPLTAVLLQLLPPALIALLFAAVGVLHVTSRVMVVDAGYKLSHLEAENRQLSLEHDRLTLELATLKAPSKLEALAHGKLGMGAPPSSAVITVAPTHELRQARTAQASPVVVAGRRP